MSMASKTLEIPGIGPVTINKKRGNRNIRLSFSRNGQVRVSVPYWVPYQAGVQFALSRRGWITTHRPKPQDALTHLARVGKAHRLQFLADSTIKPTVQVKNNLITIKHPALLRVDSPAVQAAATRGTLRALKAEADHLLPQRLQQLAQQHHFDYKSVATKRLSSRWGSCSQFKDITLNIYLMQLPWQLIDYVLLHELTHTEHLNHSAAFWARFQDALPNAKLLRKQLRAYRTAIMPTT